MTPTLSTIRNPLDRLAEAYAPTRPAELRDAPSPWTAPRARRERKTQRRPKHKGACHRFTEFSDNRPSPPNHPTEEGCLCVGPGLCVPSSFVRDCFRYAEPGMHCPRRLQNSKTPKLSGAETTDAGLRTLSWNSLRQLVAVSTNGAVVVRYAYDAWGNLLSEECTVPALASNRYRFQGREWSAATDLYNFRARWYDPETGRWLSKDPIGLAGGLNLYVFCGDDPVNLLDPSGLAFWKSFLKGVIRGAAIAAVTVAIATVAPVLAGAATAALGYAAMAATVSSAVSISVTVGLTIASTYGLVSGGLAVARAVKCNDDEAIAMVTGEFLGGCVVGGLASRGMVSQIAGKPSAAPPMYNIPATMRFERASAYNPNYPNGSLGKWLASAPTPLANTISLGLIGQSEQPTTIIDNARKVEK